MTVVDARCRPRTSPSPPLPLPSPARERRPRTRDRCRGSWGCRPLCAGGSLPAATISRRCGRARIDPPHVSPRSTPTADPCASRRGCSTTPLRHRARPQRRRSRARDASFDRRLAPHALVAVGAVIWIDQAAGHRVAPGLESGEHETTRFSRLEPPCAPGDRPFDPAGRIPLPEHELVGLLANIYEVNDHFPREPALVQLEGVVLHLH